MHCTPPSRRSLSGVALAAILVSSKLCLAQPAPDAPAGLPETQPTAPSAPPPAPAESTPSAPSQPAPTTPDATEPSEPDASGERSPGTANQTSAETPISGAATLPAAGGTGGGTEVGGATASSGTTSAAAAPPQVPPRPSGAAAPTAAQGASSNDATASASLGHSATGAEAETRSKRKSARSEPSNPTVPTDTENPESWFSRPAVKLELGNDKRQLNLTFYGILQADLIYDTTRSYNEIIGSNLVARGDTYEGTVGRSQASARNSRLGLVVSGSPLAGITPSAVIEGDFRGDVRNDQHPEPSENAFYTSPGLRMRLAYIQLTSDTIDMLIGQTWDLFARQNTFNPGSRNPQLRLSHTFGAGGSVSFDVAAAAVRPVQRDAQLPDAHAALRLYVNDWLGIGTPRGVPSARPLSIGVSAVARQFDVDAFAPPPTQRSNKIVGRGFAVDALIPVIRAEDQFDRGNKLTVMGLFVTGSGIADLTGVNGGAMFATLPNPARSNPPPEYDPNIDQGLVSFDILGVLSTIDWQAFQIGAEYYLPPIGRVMVQANYMEAFSNNLSDLYPRGGAEIELLTHVADKFRRADADVFWNVTPEVRLGWGGSFTEMEYLDKERPYNWRGRMVANYYF